MMDKSCEVTITAPDHDWLRAFVRSLVDNGLCASGHITGIESIYRWQGQLHERPETKVVLHTRTQLVAAIVERVTAEHPYEVPCVVATPITDGNPTYLTWIYEESRG
jgi:periplasmic divalent cation tolerance protein